MGGGGEEVLSNKYRKRIHLHITVLEPSFKPLTSRFSCSAAGRPASEQQVVLHPQQ